MTNLIILNALLLNENMDSTMEPCRFRDEWPQDLNEAAEHFHKNTLDWSEEGRFV